jgi:hypothetical protein
MQRRIPPRAGVFILASLIGLPLIVTLRVNERSRSAAEAESFSLLANANSADERQAAVGSLGNDEVA